MWAYDDPYYFGRSENQKHHRKSDVDAKIRHKTTVGQIFLSDNQVRFKKIFITANAGFGKTSLSQKLTMTWCQSHSPLMSLTDKYNGEELDAMKYFDYVFLLHLRDYQSEPLCNLDDLIMLMFSNNLSRNTLYTKEFLQRLLHEKKCLIIIDGMDEWAHPEKCRRTPAVPHNNHPDSCTVLTTSRHWKLGTIGLSEQNIDRHIEISELDWWTQHKLENNAVQILNKRKLNITGKRITDFDEEVRSVEVGDIIYIPYILLQLMCLFFAGLRIGKSKCQVYSNITEFTLERGLNKKDLPDIHAQLNNNAPVPNCMKENETCKRYFTLLMKLGKLAFNTLFSKDKESSLIFDRKIVTQYMAEQEIEFCLKVGLLCQTKNSSIIAVKQYQVFFQHKSVQEFFSAIYITSEWQNESVKSTIVKICSSVSNTLGMGNIFVFVCGMNPEVFTCISGELPKIGDIDSVTHGSDIIDSYQLMHMCCLKESMKNRNESCPIYLHVVLDDRNWYLNKLKTIIHFNKGHLKSLQIRYSDKTKAFMQSLDPGLFTSLETLSVEHGYEEPEWLAYILTESARTLKCLTISQVLSSLSDNGIAALTVLTCLHSLYLKSVYMTHSNLQYLYAYINKTTTLTELKLEYINCSNHWNQDSYCDVILDLHCLKELKMVDLHDVTCRELKVNPACLTLSLRFSSPSDINLTALTGLTCLHSLYLSVYMTHSNLQCLYACISQTTTLTQLKLMNIDCSDHKFQNRDCDVTLDLHRLNELKMLHLDKVPCRELRVNPVCLEKLKFQPAKNMTARARATLWQDLRASPVLSSLTLKCNSCQEMMQTIATFTQLQSLTLQYINKCRDVIPLSPAMKKLERLKLSSARMSSAAWRELLLIVVQLPHNVTVKLKWIRMTWQEWKELLLSVGGLQHPVTVELKWCRGPSVEEWKTIVNVIKITPRLSLLHDLDIRSIGDASLTLKNNPV